MVRVFFIRDISISIIYKKYIGTAFTHIYEYGINAEVKPI